ncbi:hypothetical protein HXX76_012617 [Chlamydomonas incerta]|uniref:Uncharacterized protein n=1 Tax=Chlamydomonas incerta TaxID=51695 RepID=A0A835VVX3_CHLIN|nr:hypothetical protein HXX76_012617 [Chlamydomonas incerta]|eukprot:KAG2427106.1 hypothetical protein HXX76_012617 [Chlamydomonas incerta]
MLPDDARARILGGRFTRTSAGCRLACTALRELYDSSVSHASLILGEGNAAAWQQGQQVRSPLTRLTGCHSLKLRLGHKDCDRLVSLAFVGATAADRQRITRLKVKCRVSYDMARVVETLAGRLPALEELELEGHNAAEDAAAAVVRGQLTLCAIADFFPRLRCLVLPLPGNTALAGLAACTQLRKLTMSTASEDEPHELTQAALEGLSQLQQLERLTLGCFRLRAGDESLLTQLLTTHRPPNLRSLDLLGPVGSFLDVDFTRAAGSGAQPGGRRGMRCVSLGCVSTSAGMMQCTDQLARAVLAAADQLQQLTVPKLTVQALVLSPEWRLPQYLQSDDPLPRLVARCGRVELGTLVGWQLGAPVWDPAPVLAVVRLLGLPSCLVLEHGCWEPQATQAQELASRGAAVGAGEPAAGSAATPAPVERRQTRHMALLQGQQQLAQQQQHQGVRPQQLQLGTATPEQVLLRAIDELAAEAAQAGANRGGGGGGGSRAAGGHLVLLRGALPPRDEGSMTRKAWMKGAVEHCVGLALQEQAGQQPERSRGAGGALPTAGPPSSARELERCWELIGQEWNHIAAPAAGVLLLDCGADQRAAELAALLSVASGSSSMQPRGETGSARAVTAAVIQAQAGDAADVLCSRIVKVLADMWARSEQGGGGGTGSTTGGGSSSSSNRKEANEDALRRLLALDHGVRQLCWCVQHPCRAESDSDPGTDSSVDDDDEDDDDGSDADDADGLV